MKLTPEQIDLISKEIIEGGIKYQDLYEELLDHYILAIEDRMSQGKSFDDSFNEVHSGFENYKLYLGSFYYYDARKFTTVQKANYGLVRLQSEYRDKLNKEISKKHWQIMKEYFRWPTIITTLLVGMLTFQFAYLVPRQFFIGIISVGAFTPLIVVLPQIFSQIRNYLLKRRKFISTLKSNSIAERLWIPITLLSFIINIPRGLFDYNLLKDSHLAIIATILSFYIAYSFSFYQLYRERFKVNRM